MDEVIKVQSDNDGSYKKISKKKKYFSGKKFFF